MRILLIAYYFPPINSGGTQRPVKMLKFLPRFGHQVTVLTHSYTPSSFDAPDEIRIYDKSHNCHREGIYRWQWGGLRAYTEFLNRFGRYHSIYSWWRHEVQKHADRIMAQVQPDLILATYPPIEDLELGLYLSEKFSVPLVSDFRDGLLYEPIENRMAQYSCLQSYYRSVEEAVARKSQCIITAFPRLSTYFEEKYRRERSRVCTLPNGWDKDDVLDLPRLSLDKQHFHIVHTGSIGFSCAGSDISPFIKAISLLVDEHEDVAQRLKVHFVGKLQRAEKKCVYALKKQGIVFLHGAVSRKMALAFQQNANMLLLITPEQRPGIAPGKLFEYLYTRKPILALTYESYTAEIINITHAGWVIHPQDYHSIYQTIYQAMKNDSFYHSLIPDGKEIEKFSRERQMAALDEILRTIQAR